MHWTIWLSYLLTWTLIPHILLRNKPPVSTLAWIWSVIALPYVGPLAYLLIGNDRMVRKRLRASREMEKSGAREDRKISPRTKELLDALHPDERSATETLARLNEVAISSAEDVRLLVDARRFYPALYERIDAARHHVHIEFFVVRRDHRGEEMLEHLIAAAKRGVEVRLLVDQLGSFEVRRSFFDPLCEAGGKFAWFRTAHPLRNRWLFNLRNHRKLQIIDARYAFVGGMNMGKEYASEDPETGTWRDVQIEVTGMAASTLQPVFADDWFFATEEKLLDRAYYRGPECEQRYLVQAMPDGPDTPEPSIQMSIVWMLQAARQRIWLTAGYFIPNEPLLTALKVAAARGIDVRLLVSEKSDHPFLVHIGRSYYEELLSFGVRIYEYDKGIDHAKVVLVDDRWLMVGSANFDIRSMRLNFELNLLVRHAERAAELERVLRHDFTKDSREISLAEFRTRPSSQRFLESVFRPLAPLL